jgi:hypothetical protein
LSSRHGTLATTLIAPPLQILGELFLAEAIQDALFRDTALARHLNPPVRQINFPRRVRIRIDAHHATQVERRLVPAPIKVKPPRICVDFNGDTVFGAGREDFLDIDVVPRTRRSWRPVVCPRMVVWGLETARMMRSVCAARSILNCP